MTLENFFDVFTANITGSDLAQESREDFSIRARNVVTVLRARGVDEAALWRDLVTLLAEWDKEHMRRELPVEDGYWLDRPDLEALLKELLGEIVAKLKAS